MYKVPGTGIGVGTGVGALAVTGADVTWWVVAGIALLLAGAFVVHTTRGRRRVAAPPRTGPNRAG
ncbi:LPXTG-motif cell wall anchor domain-containing protein [Lentzea xinjiangensis]|uniref:LPXTG-motif cell wall anchor domain-containing protein n=1 Tax=Lentzea xinjiangensis TaxID=402600 RepID=A0A1H9URX6_9PSEU|nr:LPXTG cell wall anchor domain-containing protein [Lentzea xinjiangensis]SES12162.1 LPXTG-motif cell wall anchor domain-containing protein [Lentzea xinjiangensis]